VTREPLEVKRRIGSLPEEMNLYERLTGEEYIHFVGRIYGLPESQVQGRTEELIDLLDMTQHKDRLIIDYSMGMRKKIGLAGALIHNPRIIFLDEPFNGVDVVSSRVVRRILTHLTGRGVTVFFSSHVMELVEKLCTRIAILMGGKIVARGTVDELRDSLGGQHQDLEDMFLQSIGHVGGERSLSWIGTDR
jgi:ABC-2 type transport system ATP-binding protein